MDRLTVITHAARDLLKRAPAGWAARPGVLPSLALVEELCAICADRPVTIKPLAAQDALLGGAWARLSLWVWTRPELGGHIFVQESLEPGARAFAIAHELGHLMLHRGEGATWRWPCPEDGISEIAGVAALRTAREGRVEEYNPRARRELEANAFAAELLAPEASVRALFVSEGGCDETSLAADFGISTQLARARLIAAVLTSAPSGAAGPGPEEAAEAQVAEQTATLDDAARRDYALTLLERLDESQRAAATAPGPALVMAGPGTGKTATLVGRVAWLFGHEGALPESILALTFSNRAADEMRARLIAAGLPGERAPVMTIHAFAAELLRRFASQAPHGADEPPLPPDFRVLDTTDALLLGEELLPQMGLRRLRSLSDPAAPLAGLLTCFSWARDRLLDPSAYTAQVKAMVLAPDPPAQAAPGQKRPKSAPKAPPGTFTADQIARAREQAQAYTVWDRELRRRGLLDYGALIQRAVETLSAAPEALHLARRAFPHILVDEFQDTNMAAAELLALLAGADGAGLWVVGDHHQSIYRWRGAAPDALPALARRYPALTVRALGVCYRSVPDIVNLGSDMAAEMTALDGASPLPVAMGEAGARRALPHRDALATAAVWRGEDFPTPADERAAVVADMRRRNAEEGVAWRDMAALSYKRNLGRALAEELTRQGVPVTARGEFFDRDEVKDALALPRLAATHDAGGLLRARGLFAAQGVRSLTHEDARALNRAIQTLIRQGAQGSAAPAFPWSLRDAALLRAVGTPERLIAPLGQIGEQAAALWRVGGGMAGRIATGLLRARGIAWRLARIAAAEEPPATSVDDPLRGPGASPARASDALAALGALVNLAWRFDTRWSREPGFREQLSGLAAPDADDGDDGESERAAPAPDASGPAEDATAAPDKPALDPAIRCFLRYIGALLRAHDEVVMPPGEEDAVRVLTIHGAKGLEFPAVYLLGLAPGAFQGPPSAVVDPTRPAPGDGHDPRAEEAAADHRSLLYVAATRARDTLTITRARTYKRDGRNPEGPLAAAVVLAASPVYERAPQLAPAPDAARLPDAADVADAGEEDPAADVEAAGGATSPYLADVAGDVPLDLTDMTEAADKPVYSLYALEMYEDCPRRYRYHETYHLRDGGTGAAVGAFHRFVRRGLEEQRRMRAERPAVTPEEARATLASLWDDQPGARSAHHQTFKEYALAILDAEFQRVDQEQGERARLDLTAGLRACRVSLTVDAVTLPDGAVILELARTSRPSEAHQRDARLPLALMAWQQGHPGASVSLRLVYLGAPLAEVNDATPGDRSAAARQRQMVDMTGQARKYVNDYHDGRGAYKGLTRLDAAARAIAARAFDPRPAERCATCAYTHVCPADLPE